MDAEASTPAAVVGDPTVASVEEGKPPLLQPTAWGPIRVPGLDGPTHLAVLGGGGGRAMKGGFFGPGGSRRFVHAL